VCYISPIMNNKGKCQQILINNPNIESHENPSCGVALLNAEIRKCMTRLIASMRRLTTVISYEIASLGDFVVVRTCTYTTLEEYSLLHN
jgi:hypothetical protein